MNTDWPFGALQMFGYDMIMADPPWQFDTWSLAGKQHKSPESHYETMPTDQIAAFPVDLLAGRDAILWLWATHPMLPQQIEVMKAWKFKFVTSGVWVKRTKTGKLGFGTGYRLRCASEPFLIGAFGDPATAKNIRTVIEGPIRKHSQKPDEAFAAAELMWPMARRVELFSRTKRAGWDTWGKEDGKFGVAA